MKGSSTYLATAGALVGALMLATAASAHHAFNAEYDAKQPIVLKGKLSKMEWTNPHGWIYVDVQDRAGKVVTWEVETGSPNALLRRGLRRKDFPIGSELIINAFKAKNGRPEAAAYMVKFADGRNFYLGASGTGAPEPPKENPPKAP